MAAILQQTATRYDTWARLNRGGFNNVNSVPDNGLADSALDWLAQGGQAILAPAQQKLDNLDKAIKALLVMGGISSICGLVLVFRGR